MASLIVRNLDEAVVKALKMRASQNGVSAEAEHRKILEQVLRPPLGDSFSAYEVSPKGLKPQKKNFSEVLRLIPNVGNDSDFERLQDDRAGNVFD